MNSTDPRGPMRRITHIDTDSHGHPFITTDCGHTYSRNGTFSYKVGEPLRCMVCLENEQRRS